MTSNVFIDYVHNARPCMRDATVLQGKHWRIGILTESLIRLEWSDSGEFEDRLTQMAVNRDFGADPEFTVTHRNGLLIVDTPALYLTYDGKPFSKEGLSIVVKGVSDTQFKLGITAMRLCTISKVPRVHSTRLMAKSRWMTVYSHVTVGL